MTPPTFHLTFATPTLVVYEGPAISLQVPGQEGSFEVLAHHAAIIALTKPGTALLQTPNGKTSYTVSQGSFEMSNNSAFLLVDEANSVTG